MPCNIGKVDIGIRVVIGLVLIVVAAYFQSIVVGILGVVALATGMTRFCPLYSLFKLNTGCKE